MNESRKDHASGADDVTEVVANQQPPPRYLGSDFAPLPPHAPPPRAPLPPPPYVQHPKTQRSQRGLIIGGAVAACVILTATIVAVVINLIGDDDGASTATAPNSTLAPKTSAQPSSSPGARPIDFTFSNERRDIGNEVVCTERGRELDVILGRNENAVTLTLGVGPDTTVRRVHFTIDGSEWSYTDAQGADVAFASGDGRNYVVSGTIAAPEPERRGIRSYYLGFTCP